MSLSMLVGGGAECGPSNPLQSLTKQFDQDRGVQQDVAGPSRAHVPFANESHFRTQHAQIPGLQQEAARFFGSAGPALPPVQVEPRSTSMVGMGMGSGILTTMPAFDVAGLRDALPAAGLSAAGGGVGVTGMGKSMDMGGAGGVGAVTATAAGSAWAADFLARQPERIQAQMSTPATVQAAVPATRMDQVQHPSAIGGMQGGSIPWSPVHAGYAMNMMGGMANAMVVPVQRHVVQSDQLSWDREFQSQASMLNATAVPTVPEVVPAQEQSQRPLDGQGAAVTDDMARIAGLVMDSVKHEQNPKFQKSQFMNLMRQLRDGEMTVGEDDIVPKTQATADVKGKGRADMTGFSQSPSQVNIRSSYQGGEEVGEASVPQVENPHEAYFRQDNAEFTEYWNAHYTGPAARTTSAQDRGNTEWDRLQRDWDAFEATTTGVKPVANYQFQTNNPYALGESSRTRHHDVHMSHAQEVYENVLELEAAVQGDPTNAAAWFELGVKQQENEREAKAIQALERAVELDPSHLPTWLALSVSYTNEGNRLETCYAIRQWMKRNRKYEAVVSTMDAVMRGGRLEDLISVLIQMARSRDQGQEGSGVDADVQVALAVLLNVAEDYPKAVDCFVAALAVRPDDWLLYNRVGATMANSGRAAEALQYYHRALELNPGYIRARFNLGISCINLRYYDEAASHILDALVLQDNDGIADNTGFNDARGVTSSALWESLKTTSLHIQRAELAALCDRRDLNGFRKAFYGME